MAGISSDGGESMGTTGGDPMSGDMPLNDPAFPGCGPAPPFCEQSLTARLTTASLIWDEGGERPLRCG